MRYPISFAVHAALTALVCGGIVASAAVAQQASSPDGPAASASAGEDAVADRSGSTAPETRQHAQTSAPDNAGNILTDADRTHWQAAKLRQFAVEKTSGQEVRSFAKESAETLHQQATLLEQAAKGHAALRPATADSARSASDTDLSETGEEIGEAVRERLRQRAERRGGELAAGDTPAIVEDDPELTDRRDRDNARRERLLAGRGDREAARERLRVLLPALREELPDLFEVLGEAVEDETVGAAAWVDYQRKVAERVLAAKQEELQRYQGQEFDQAFLGMALVEAIELEAVAATVAQQAAPTLQEVVNATARQLREQAETSRTLMEQTYQPEGSQISSNQSPRDPSLAK